LEKGRTLYPTDDYWTEVELERVEKSGDKQALIAKYEELMKRYPQKFSYPYNLSVSLYNQLYIGDTRPADAVALQNKLTELLKTAINLDKAVDSRNVDGTSFVQLCLRFPGFFQKNKRCKTR